MSKKLLYNFLFSLILFQSIITKDISWDYKNNGFVSDGLSSGENFSVKFQNGLESVELYIKINITTKEGPTPFLCFSTVDTECQNRNQLVYNAIDKTALIWIKKGEIVKNFLYIRIFGDIGSYVLEVRGSHYAEFNPNFVYSYLVGSQNKEMEFLVKNIPKDSYLTIGLDGSSCSLEVVEHYGQYIDYKTGKAITLSFIDGEGISEITIRITKAVEGDYITLSVHSLTVNDYKEGKAEENVLVPNGPPIIGYIWQDFIKEECFPVNFSNYEKNTQMFVTGRINNKYAWAFLADESNKWIEEYDLEIVDGLISFPITFNDTNSTSLRYICIEIPFEESLHTKEVSFSIALTSDNKTKTNYFLPPQKIGQIYRYMVPKDQSISFHGMTTDNSAKKYDYNVFSRYGMMEVRSGKCKTFPICNTLEGEKNVSFINQMAIWVTTKDDSAPIKPEKNEVNVKCIDTDRGYCEFEASIFDKGRDTYLVEDEKFYKYAQAGEEGRIFPSINYIGRKIQRLNIDIMFFSGDVVFDLKSDFSQNEFSLKNYSLANKVSYVLNFDYNEAYADIYIEYKSITNSFFSIKYSIHQIHSEQKEEYIPSGESYLVQINPNYVTKSKNIYIENLRTMYTPSIFVNFFSLNCELEVKRNDKEVEFYDGYAQEIIANYANNALNYSIKIKEEDTTNVNNKMCMVYVAGYEMTNKENNNREILIAENVNQQVIFEGELKEMRFLFPHTKTTKSTITLYVNVIDKANYNITTYFPDGHKKILEVTRSQIFYFDIKEFTSCFDMPICPLTFVITWEAKLAKTSNPMIEITVRELEQTPTYLQKGQAKKDYVAGDNIYYLYTDLGKNEVGSVRLNFFREYGTIWGKIVKKNVNPEEGFNWRNRYRMPSAEKNDFLPFDEYTKTLTIKAEDTADCIDGCYLLMSIKINEIGEFVPDEKFYPFSIITKFSPNSKAYNEIPKIVIQVDEFIIGNVDIADDDKIYEFYEIWLPHDSDVVEFDWQSTLVTLYIKLGGIRPTTKNYDFKFVPAGKNSIFTLTKEEIKTKAKENKIPVGDSLEDVSFVIGMWTDKSDSINNELYSLRVHQKDLTTEEIDIIEINTDQRVICSPKKYNNLDNKYACLFIVLYDLIDCQLATPLIAFGTGLNHSSINHLYVKYIDTSIYDRYDNNTLKANIPQKMEDPLTKEKFDSEYIYISELKNGSYAYISIISDSPYDIMIVTSMPVFDYLASNLFQFYPNSNTEQILVMNFGKLNITFPGTESISASLVCLYGYGRLFWEKDPSNSFYLNSEGDRLTVFSGSKKDNLMIVNDKFDMEYNTTLVFYISYHLRKNVNFDEVKYGKSIELNYKETNLPIVIYNKIGSEYSDINVAITFKDNKIDESGEYIQPPLTMMAYIIKENSLYIAKEDPDLSPHYEYGLLGNYNMALKTAQIFISKDNIQKFNVKAEDIPTLFVMVESEQETQLYNQFSVEAQISGVNDGVIPLEKIYHYGKVRNNGEKTIYRLKTNPNKKYMRVHVSFNSELLNFYISNKLEKEENITFVNTEKEGGKIVVTFEVQKDVDYYNLVLYKKKGEGENLKCNNYAFKYMNGQSLDSFVDFKIKSSNVVNVTQSFIGKEYQFKCQFNKIDVEKDKANITYFLRVIKEKINDENYNSIAATDSEYMGYYQRNPKDEDGIITFTTKSKSYAGWQYIDVIAQIQQTRIIEYVSYVGLFSKVEISDDSSLSEGRSTSQFFEIKVTEDVKREYVMFKVYNFEDGNFATLKVNTGEQVFTSEQHSDNNLLYVPSIFCRGRKINIEIVLNEANSNYNYTIKTVDDFEIDLGENVFIEMLEGYNKKMNIKFNTDKVENKFSLIVQSSNNNIKISNDKKKSNILNDFEIKESELFRTKGFILDPKQGSVSVKIEGEVGNSVKLYTYENNNDKPLKLKNLNHYGYINNQQDSDCLSFEETDNYSKYQIRFLSDKDISITINDKNLNVDFKDLYIYNLEDKKNKICIKANDKNVFYSMQIVNKEKEFNDILFPITLGTFYSETLSEGKMRYYNQFLYEKDEYEDLRYISNLKVQTGTIKGYFIECNSYPNCKVDQNELKGDVFNQVKGIHYYSKQYSKPKFTHKNVLQYVFICVSKECKYSFIYYDNITSINLSKNKEYLSHLDQGKIDKYLYYKEGEHDIYNIILDVSYGILKLTSSDCQPKNKSETEENMQVYEFTKDCFKSSKIEFNIIADSPSLYKVQSSYSDNKKEGEGGQQDGSGGSDGEDEDKPNTVVIILSVIIGVLVIALILFIIHYFMKRRKRRIIDIDKSVNGVSINDIMGLEDKLN